MKKFEGLLKSEIKKINKFAQKRDNKDSCITGYGYNSNPDELGFIEITCEICSNNMNDREEDIIFEVFMPDRRRSFVVESLSKQEAKIMDIDIVWNDDELEAIEELNEIFNLQEAKYDYQKHY